MYPPKYAPPPGGNFGAMGYGHSVADSAPGESGGGRRRIRGLNSNINQSPLMRIMGVGV